MAHHFVDRLEELRTRMARMSTLVQQVVEQACDSVVRLDAALAEQVIDADKRVDDEEVKIEKAAIDLLALYQPAASDLRLITIIIKANSDLERIADCAVNIAQRVRPLSQSEGYEVPIDLRAMASSVTATLRQTIQAFNLIDAGVAGRVMKGDDLVDALYAQLVQDMLTTMRSDRGNADSDFSNIMIAKNLERIGDHCTNIAEDVIYVASGKIIRHMHATA